MSGFQRSSLRFKAQLPRNRWNLLYTCLAGVFAAIAVLPLVLVLAYVLVKGGSLISLQRLTQLPPPPGLDGGEHTGQAGVEEIPAVAGQLGLEAQGRALKTTHGHGA